MNFTHLQERKKGNADEKDREEELTEKACKIKQRPSYSLPEFPRYTKVNVMTKYLPT